MINWLLIFLKVMAFYWLINIILEAIAIQFFGREQVMGVGGGAHSINTKPIGNRALFTLLPGLFICLQLASDLPEASITPSAAFAGCLAFALTEMGTRLQKSELFDSTGHLQTSEAYQRSILVLLVVSVVGVVISYVSLSNSISSISWLRDWLSWTETGIPRWALFIWGGVSSVMNLYFSIKIPILIIQRR